MRDLKHIGRVIIKIGSSLLTDDGKGLNLSAMKLWAKQIAKLCSDNIEVIIITSGAIAEGIKRLGLSERPKLLNELQATAAIGQMGLAQGWENALSAFNIKSAQILLTHDDLRERERYLNARSTILTLLQYKVVPVINENDTVVTDEIKLGDNDTLGALVTNLVEANLLILLTDQEGLYTDNPRTNPNAKLINTAIAGDPQLLKMAGSENAKGSLGKGGMATKVKAAERAARSGAATIIANGRQKDVLEKIFAGENIGTFITSNTTKINARKQWLANHLRSQGKITIDEGAHHALINNGKSLLAVGVKNCEGSFTRGEMVSIFNLQENEIARGLINYSSKEVNQIMGLTSEEIEKKLGYHAEAELIHRDNLVIVN